MNADMSQGLEKVSVSWVNRFDGKPLPSFKYISTCVLHEDLQDHQFEVFEEDRCCSSSFNRGSLIDGTQKDDLRECRVGCKNGPLSNGIKHKFQVFCKLSNYWAVRALSEIPKNSFIGEYTGIVSKVMFRENDTYIFQTNDDTGTFLIDAFEAGNFTRFINHSCDPNVNSYRIQMNGSHPRMALFATKEIAKGEELTIDYGEQWWMVKRSQVRCICRSPKCRYS